MIFIGRSRLFQVDRVQKIQTVVVDDLDNQLAEEGVLPCEPPAGEVADIADVERLVHESCSGIGAHQHLDLAKCPFFV